MRQLRINPFWSRTDGLVRPLSVSWDDLVGLLTSGHEVFKNKEDSGLFNGVRYKDVSDIPGGSDDWFLHPLTGDSFTRRRLNNIVELDLLILDYDGGISVEEIKNRFSDYEYICYSSFRHLYDGETHKFRVVIPLETPIPGWSKKENNILIDGGGWFQIINSLKKFAGPCDPKSFDPSQIYSIPSVSEDRLNIAFSFRHEGKWLDWTQFDRVPFDQVDNDSFIPVTRSTVKAGDRFLKPDDVLQTSQGPIVVSDVIGKIDGVVCPFHNDKNGSEFVRRVEHTGNIFIYCSHCECKYYMRKEDAPSPEPVAPTRTPELEPDRIPNLDEVITLDLDRKYFDASDRRRVIEQLAKIEFKIFTDRGELMGYWGDRKKYGSHIIFMPEGSGKSHLVTELARKGRKIIFACKSWDQAESKFQDYKSIGDREGFGVDIVRSKDAKARRRFSTKLIRGESKSPFSTGRVLDKESIESFIKNNPDLNPDFIRLSWCFFSSDRLSFEFLPRPIFNQEGDVIDEFDGSAIGEETKIVVTSFEQLRLHHLRNFKIPDDWIIWFDDPDINDVIDIHLYKEADWDLSDQEVSKRTIDVNGKTYFRRDPDLALGYSLRHHKCIYTTTEEITRRAIEKMLNKRKEEFVLHDEMEDIVGGKITILGTEMVRARYDGIIPPIIRRLNKMGYPSRLIADGLSSEFNHSNNKGRNDLARMNIIVELSIPHPDHIRTVCDALELPFSSSQNEVCRLIMLDRQHQAIGRNSGYRYEGYECVVLVDKNVCRYMKRDTRYLIDKENSVVIDRLGSMGRDDRRTTKEASEIVKEIETLLINIIPYVSDKRKIKPDIEYVINRIESPAQREKYIIRLLTSLREISGISFNPKYVDRESEGRVETKFREVGDWILETWVTDEERLEFVIKKVG